MSRYSAQTKHKFCIIRLNLSLCAVVCVLRSVALILLDRWSWYPLRFTCRHTFQCRGKVLRWQPSCPCAYSAQCQLGGLKISLVLFLLAWVLFFALFVQLGQWPNWRKGSVISKGLLCSNQALQAFKIIAVFYCQGQASSPMAKPWQGKVTLREIKKHYNLLTN